MARGGGERQEGGNEGGGDTDGEVERAGGVGVGRRDEVRQLGREEEGEEANRDDDQDGSGSHQDGEGGGGRFAAMAQVFGECGNERARESAFGE